MTQDLDDIFLRQQKRCSRRALNTNAKQVPPRTCNHEMTLARNEVDQLLSLSAACSTV